VVVSHAYVRAVHDSRRNVPDDWVKAMAETGGIDYFLGQYPVENPEQATARYNGLAAAGLWRPDECPPPP